MYVEKTFQHMKATTTLPKMGKEQLDLARRHLIKAFLPLLQTAPNERRRWRGTKIDPYAPVSKGMLRKNVYQRPVLERYGWLLFEQNRPQPLQEWLDMDDHTHR